MFIRKDIKNQIDAKNLIYSFSREKKEHVVFTSQKGPLCVLYGMLQLLHFHGYHPKYYSDKKYSNNFILGIEAFKEIRNFCCDVEEDNSMNNSSAEKYKILEKAIHNIILDYLKNKVSLPQHYNHLGESAQNQSPKFELRNYMSLDNFFAYVFGFKVITNQKAIQEQKNPGDYLADCLLQHGPILMGGQFTLNEDSKPHDIEQFSADAYEFKFTSVDKSHFQIDKDQHCIVVIGINTYLENQKVHYIDPNYPNHIIAMNLTDFVERLDNGNVLYFPCPSLNLSARNDAIFSDQLKDKMHCCHIKDKLQQKNDASEFQYNPERKVHYLSFLSKPKRVERSFQEDSRMENSIKKQKINLKEENEEQAMLSDDSTDDESSNYRRKI